MRTFAAARQRLLRQIHEKEWTQTVVDLARATGWLVHHSRPARNARGDWSTALQGAPGLPDLVLLRPPRLIFAELKTETGKLTEAQVAWLVTLEKLHWAEAYVWRPSDAEAVAAILQARAGP